MDEGRDVTIKAHELDRLLQLALLGSQLRSHGRNARLALSKEPATTSRPQTQYVMDGGSLKDGGEVFAIENQEEA